ncbi:hypothetical protein K458DRAFT_429734 [Lentithecium fluviatile CBS 122367]|uniref:DUF3176 domain containing protein n=1 Tax=Lentithecium fluviatile CBS 122367 TaxID=1168545 RepID=A0A6G1J991_9PLEO|nr:hypothetical protein K458DRAFT_429734 [Lentithecium fluviatile CBS 122367]
MPNIPVSPISFSNADIPIYLDTTHNRTTLEQSEHICPKCSVNSRDQPIHCISVSPAPPPYASVAPQATAQGRLAVPSLNVQTRGQWAQPVRPNRPAPAFRPDDGGRHVRFRHNAFSPVSPQTPQQGLDNVRPHQIGLGIPAAPFKLDISPITPGSAEKAQTPKEKHAKEGISTGLSGASNFAQRLEERLWKYSASGNVVKRWLMEIISWSISAICMAAIIIVLHHYQHQPLPKWPLGITLNAYISVLAKFASAALLLPVSEALGQLKWNWFQKKNECQESRKMWDFELFDNASRGPWGSFMLLLRTRGRSLAALGAAVTLFALALDPFFQQVVGFPEKWQVQPLNGTISRALTYSVDSAGVYLKDGIPVSETDQCAAYHYVFASGTNPTTSGSSNRMGPDIPLTCPNSKCTWEQTEIAGIPCWTGSQLLRRRPTGLLGTIRTGRHVDGFLKADSPLLMTGYIAGLDTNYTGREEVLISRSQPLYDINTRAFLPGYPAKLNNTRNPILHLVVVSGGDDVSFVKRNATPVAHECIVSWCVKTMQSSLVGGLYSENVSSTVYNKTLGADPWDVSPIYENGEFFGMSFSYNENITIVGNSGHPYEISNITHDNILRIFDDYFPSTYTAHNATSVGMAGAELRYQQWLTSAVRSRIPDYNPFLYDNITLQFDNMAATFTNIMRSSQDTIEIVQGPAFDLVSVVLVRWEWLSLPLGLLGFTFIFLTSTIIRSSMYHDLGVWKTSAIATLLYGLPDDVRKKVTSQSARANGTPRANAKHTKLKWLPGTGWRRSGASALSPSSLRSRHTPPQSEWKG